MRFFVFCVCLIASVIGGICGIGGGIIMKTVLDSFHLMSVSSLSFLSGLTALSMAAVSVWKQRSAGLVEFRIGTALAIGASFGGIIGNLLFQLVKTQSGNESAVGLTQSLLLAFVTLCTLLYTARYRKRLRSPQVKSLPLCVVIGVGMSMISSFLGIGGGPINLAVLYYFFDMDTKKAAANSLYIIFFSQLASFLLSVLRYTVPEFDIHFLFTMVPAGILGGMIGSRVNKRLPSRAADLLFLAVLVLIIALCLYNAQRFYSEIP